MRVKAQKEAMLEYGFTFKAAINIRYNQIWEVTAVSKNNSMWLYRNGVSINITKENFEKYFTPLKET